MSFSVTHARIKYSGFGYAATAETRKQFLASTPRGVAISKPGYTPTSNRLLQSSEAKDGDSFFGLSMAPTLSAKEVSHIGIAVDGIATAVMKQDSGGDSPAKSTLYGSRAYGVGTQLTCENGELKMLTDPEKEKCVAYYLQKNGPNTALVWIVKNKMYEYARLAYAHGERPAGSKGVYFDLDSALPEIPYRSKEREANRVKRNLTKRGGQLSEFQLNLNKGRAVNPLYGQANSKSRKSPVKKISHAPPEDGSVQDATEQQPQAKKRKKRKPSQKNTDKPPTESPAKTTMDVAPDAVAHL